MKSPVLLLAGLCLAALAAPAAHATDTTPPVLRATHTWIVKENGFYHFNLLLDPQDETGIQKLEVREKINATSIPANTPWRDAIQDGIYDPDVPWKSEEPLTLAFNCTSMVLQVRAVDTSGNYSEVITRSYKSPFPLSPAPNLTPAFGATPLLFQGAAPLDCRALHTGDFDGDGRDDVVVFDRAAARVTLRRQQFGNLTSQDIQVAPDSLTDGAVADFDGDGRSDIAVVVENSVTVYLNQGVDNGGLVQFQSSQPAGLSGTGIAQVRHIAAGDVTGEGKPDLVISGIGDGGLGGDGSTVGVLINNDQFDLAAGNFAFAPTGATPGRLALGDFNGDGWTDAAMIDTAGKQVVIFQNKANGSFGSADEANTALRPLQLQTGPGLGAATGAPSLALAPQSLAVGDVTGDGRPDIIVTMHAYLGTGAPPPVYRNMTLWQLLENRGGNTFHRWYEQLVSQSGPAESETTFTSDVVLQDLNNDRLPELVFASHFDNGIRAVRFMPQLNRQNQLESFSVDSTAIGDTANPQRVTAARFGANSKKDIVVAHGATTQLNWWFTTSSINSSKTLDIIGGASTTSNPTGHPGVNGALSYTAYPGDDIQYSLNYFNNSTENLTGVVLETAIPKGLYFSGEADPDYESSHSGGVTYLRWTLDIPAGTSGVKNFTVEIDYATKAKATFAPKNALKNGTKTLVSGVMPSVQILAHDFDLVANSFGQPWTFNFTPLLAPPAGAQMRVQASTNGVNWYTLSAPAMTRVSATALHWALTTDEVPAGSTHFRAAIISPGSPDGCSSLFGTYLPPTTGFKVSTKSTATSPPKSGNPWKFTATQAGTAPNLTVRFQSTLTPGDEGSWTDLPVYAPAKRAGNVWTSDTYNVPTGARYFRAISAAPGWVDSISDYIGPVNVVASPPDLPFFTHWHISGVSAPAAPGEEYNVHQGDLVTFIATTANVPGLKVRFQSKLHSDTQESAWIDLGEGTMTVSGTTWTFKTKYLPLGFRDFRAISSAPGYTDNTTLLYKGVEYSTSFAFLVKDPRLPQFPTIFGDFALPNGATLMRSDVNVPLSLMLFDFNGVQRVYVEAAMPGGVYKEIPGTNMVNSSDITWTTNIKFTGTGARWLRIAVVDQFNPAQVCWSNQVYVEFGPGNGGGSGPTFGPYANTIKQPTPTARGSVTVKLKIGDDSKVRYADLYETLADGTTVRLVGVMKAAGATNPADFSLTDTNLGDGTYRYGVVAYDYDGNATGSPVTGPITLVTEKPPPAPIHIDVAWNSRLAMPTVPSGKYNHAKMPYPTASKVKFSYSGLPSGSFKFIAYRTDLGPERPCVEATVSKPSGTVELTAPFWTADTKNPNAGEGDYEIACFQGGLRIGHASGVSTFTVGHAWNLPNTFTTLDYGLYWFKDGRNALKGVANQNDEYFDPSKPTVIYVHGWQPDEVSVKRREGWMREDAYNASKTYDTAKIWKDRGYNVGMFNWNQFGNSGGPDGLIYSQTNVYAGKVVAQQDFLPAGHSMLYALHGGLDSKKKAITNYYYQEPGSGGELLGKSVCDLFFDELERCLKNYDPSDDKELRVVGHSLGTQVVGCTMWNVMKNPGRGVPKPTRIALLEIAQVNVGTIIPEPNEDFTVNELQFAFIDELINNGVAVEAYQSTDLQSYLGATLSKVGPLHDLTAYARVRPDHVAPLDFVFSHNDIPRWYFGSMEYEELPAYTYWAPFVKRDYVGKALSASSPLSWVRTLMGERWWYEQSEGKNTVGIADDAFELHDDR